MQLGNWIRQTTTTTGTGDLTLASVSGWATFSSQFTAGADGAGDYFYYAVVDDSTGAPLEAGIGRLSASTTLVRSRVLATLSSGTYSEANTPLSLPAGTKRVICSDLAGARRMSVPGIRNSDSTNRLLGPGNIHTSGGNSFTLNAANIYCIAFEVVSPCFVSGMAVRVNTSAASSSVRLGLYRVNANLEPGDLIDGTGDIVTTASGQVSANFSGGTRRLRAGWYFAALNAFGGNPQILGAEGSGRIVSSGGLLGGDHGTGNPTVAGSVAYATQALPTSFPTVTSWLGATSNFMPMAYLVATAP
jgi:hypothetical protein